MFKKLKNMATKKLIQSQLKNLPKDQAEMIERMFEKDPDLFMKIAKEAQEMVKQGEDQMTAMMKVGRKYQKELQQLMQ